MHHQKYFLIRQTMSSYTSKGKKSDYKKKQMKRLVAILEDIIEKEADPRLEAIGKRQIIRYWKRSLDAEKTQREKYSILCQFFNVFNPKVKVPAPKRNKGDKEE